MSDPTPVHVSNSEQIGVPPELPPPDAVGSPPLLSRIGGLRAQALLAVVLKAVAASSALLLQWLIARSYGPHGTGLFALMSTTAIFIGVLSVGGQDYIALRNVAGDLAEGKVASARAQARASLKIGIIGAAAGTMVLVLVAAGYGFGLNREMMPILLLATPVVAGLSIGRICAFVARASGRLIASQIPDGPLTSTISLAGLALAVAIWHSPPTWSLGAIYGAAYMGALIFSYRLYRKVRAGWPADFDPIPLCAIAISGLPLILANASPYFSEWLIIFSATTFFDTEGAGQIRLVSMFLSVMYLITVALDSVIAPSMASAIRLRDQARLRRLYRNYILLSLALNIPFIALGTLAPSFYLGLFGPSFLAVAEALRFAVIIQCITILLGPAGMVLIMARRERLTIVVNVVGFVVVTLGCFLIMPRYGLTGAALISSLVLLSKRLCEFILMSRHLPAEFRTS